MKRIRKKPADRRSSIIDVAQDLFQSKEYEKVTMQDVMDILGIAKGTIYHYFPSKEALFEAVIEGIVTTNINQMRDLIQTTSGTALEKIQLLVSAGDISADNPNILDGIHQSSNSAMHSRILASMLTKQAELYAQLIKRGCEEGVFDIDNPRECAELLLAGMQFLTDMGIYQWSAEDLDRRRRSFPKLLEQFLKAPSGSFDFMLQIGKLKK